MELIFVLTILLIEVLLINLFEVVEIVRTFRINTLMDNKVFAILYVRKSIAAVRTTQSIGFGKAIFRRREVGIADFAFDLPFSAVVTVEIRLRSIAGRTLTIQWDIAILTSGDRLDFLMVLEFEVRDQELPVPVIVVAIHFWKFVGFKLLILWRVRVVMSPLLKGDIFADEEN